MFAWPVTERDAVMTAWNRDKGQIKVAVEQERERMEMSTKLRLEQRKERRKKLNEMKAEQKRREEELAAAREAAEMKRVEEEAAKREAELVARAAAADRARQSQLETAKKAFQNRLAERLNMDEGAEVTDVMVRCPEVAQRLGGIYQMSKVSATSLSHTHTLSILCCAVRARPAAFSPSAIIPHSIDAVVPTHSGLPPLPSRSLFLVLVLSLSLALFLTPSLT